MQKESVKISRFLSLVLRHQPDAIGIQLDAQGWVAIEDLLQACARHGRNLSRATLEEVVRSNDKQRFAISDDGLKIRASQGHSVAVELAYEPRTPPPLLYHGTATRFLEAIKKQGLSKGKRHHVHLSADAETATRVGARHGKAAVLIVESLKMQEAGFPFYQSANGVWLTESVPPEFLRFPQD